MSYHRPIVITSLVMAIAALPFSISVCHASLGIYLITWSFEGEWRKKWNIFIGQPIIWIYAIMFILHLVGIIYSGNVSNAWFNVEKKVVLLLIPATMVTTMTLKPEDLRTLWITFITTCLAASIICVFVALTHYQTGAHQINFDNITLRAFYDLNPTSSEWWMPFSYIQLASGIDMHPTFLALYIMFSVALGFHLVAPSFPEMSILKKTVSVMVLLWLCIFVYFLSSRIIIAAMLIAAIFLVSRRKAIEGWAGVVILLTFVWIFIYNPVTRYRNWQEIIAQDSYKQVDGLFAYSTGIRLSLWQSATDAIQQGNFLTGAGTGDVEETMMQATTARHAGNIIGTFDPHNEFMFLLIALGLPGLICWILCLALPAWTAIRQKDFIYLFLVLTFTMVCLTESAMESQKGIVFFTLFISLFLFKHRLSPIMTAKRLQ